MNVPIDISNIMLMTERLTLRSFKEKDLEDLYEYAKVNGVGQMAGWLPHKNKEESKQILDRFMNEKKTVAIVYCNKVIGSLGIDDYDEKICPELNDMKCCELGFVLSKDYWGKGIMSEVLKAVEAYLFNCEGFDVIICGYFNFNKQSARVQEKTGFTYYKAYDDMDVDHRPCSHIINILRKEDYYQNIK